MGDVDSVIPLWKDENLLLDYQSFWAKKEIWRPYIAKALTEEAVRNYELSLAACTPRIQIIAEERAEEILNNIQVRKFPKL